MSNETNTNSSIESQSTLEARAKQLENQYGTSIANNIPFIQALRVAQRTSQVVDQGICQTGDLYFGADTPLKGGATCIVIANRDHAIKLEQRKKTAESYNMVMGSDGKIAGDETFLSIVNGVDDNKRGLVHMWGPELLVFINEINEFAILFLGKGSSRKHWKEFLNPAHYNPGNWNKPVKIYTKKEPAEGSQLSYTWFEPRCRLAVPEELKDFCLPQQARIDAALAKWAAKSVAEEGEVPPER